MEFNVNRTDLIRALSTLVFSKFNAATSSMKFEVSNTNVGNLYSCSGHFANRANFPIELIPDVMPEETSFVMNADGILAFINSIPSEKINIKKTDNKIRIRGSWMDGGKENYIDQTYQASKTEIPKVDKFLEKIELLGDVPCNILLEGFRYIKNMFVKDNSLKDYTISVVDGTLTYIDDIKVGVFKTDVKLPTFALGFDEVGALTSFLDPYKNQKIKVSRFNVSSGGYAFQAEDNSLILYGYDQSKESTLTDALKVSSDLPIVFQVENKKLLNNFGIVKTNASQLFDEMDIAITNFESKLSIVPEKIPDEGVSFKLQFTNLYSVLKAFPKDNITISIDTANKKLRIEADIKIPLAKEGDESNMISGKLFNILSYWK
jgi:hypothetical protein